MKKIMTVARRFHDDEDGAAMVEYTILLGIITVAVIGLIIGVGGWVGGRWSGLCTALNASGIGTCAANSGS